MHSLRSDIYLFWESLGRGSVLREILFDMCLRRDKRVNEVGDKSFNFSATSAWRDKSINGEKESVR